MSSIATIWLVHVFFLDIGSLNPDDIQETEEMQPKWYDDTDIPFENMWEDDRVWYPLMLKGLHFHGVCHFLESVSKSDLPKMTSHAIETTDKLYPLDEK